MANKKPWEDEPIAGRNEAYQTAFADAQKRAAAQLGEQLDAANLTGAGSAAIDRVRKYRQSTPGQTANMGQTANQAAVDKASKDLVSKDLMDEYLNRGKFSYNAAADPLYQQYRQQYLNAGQMAMKDTLGKATALTGGFDNSYANIAAQQVNNEYAAKAADKIPELYQLALDRYNQEGQDILNRYELLYGRERDAVSDAQWQAQFDENVRQYDLTRADQREQFAAQMQLDRDKFEESVRQFGLEYALEQAKFDRAKFESDRDYNRGVFESDRNYNRGVFESDRNYNRGVFESDRNYNRGVFESDRDYNLSSYKAYNSGSGTPSEEDYEEEEDPEKANFTGSVSLKTDEDWSSAVNKIAAEMRRGTFKLSSLYKYSYEQAVALIKRANDLNETSTATKSTIKGTTRGTK